MTNDMLLGARAAYPDRYDPSLLEPIARQLSRASLPGASRTGNAFFGQDIWTAYELSWLDPRGKPVVALAEFRFPASTPNIVESKSLKYYLNSLNQEVYADLDAVKACIVGDLSAASGGSVEAVFYSPRDLLPGTYFSGFCVDDLAVDISRFSPDSSLLRVGQDNKLQQQLFSHLLKSNCPVTGQPDWASVWIEYTGREILPESFLQYIVSFRQHQDFHEHCVERIYCDIWQQCQPEYLSVYARYTRRGGLDINPFRSSVERVAPGFRCVRQ